jgi:hypothetical protein
VRSESWRRFSRRRRGARRLPAALPPLSAAADTAAPAPARYYPPPPVVEPPPPLSPVTRADLRALLRGGLIVRYGFYYLLVAPFEVFGRTVAYGVHGGVEPPPPAAPAHDEGSQ